MVTRLGIDRLPGSILCAQVRWATFGAVDATNAQPHVVRCKTYIYGAHNGNVTNCDELKVWLESEGHRVASDNDGEMVVHTVEHFFAQRAGGARDPDGRKKAMREAISEAGKRLKGSYATSILDPVSRSPWGVKKGCSPYLGTGDSGPGGRFGIASSDLGSVLKLARATRPLSEGDFVEFTPAGHQLYRLDDGRPFARKLV